MDPIDVHVDPSEGIHFTAEDVLQYSCNPSTLMRYLDYRFVDPAARKRGVGKPHLKSLELPSSFNDWDFEGPHSFKFNFQKRFGHQ